MRAIIHFLSVCMSFLFGDNATQYGNQLAFGFADSAPNKPSLYEKKPNPLKARNWFLKAEWSGIGIVDGRGKFGGNVAAPNRYGPYVRTKSSPINRNTSYQTAVRATFSALSSAWSTLLTEAQRQAWRGFQQDHPFTNIFGRQRSLDGHAGYIAANAALQNAGMTQVTDPPTIVDTGFVGDLTLTATVAAGGTLTVATNEVDVDAGSQINVYATKVMSNGRNFVKSQLNYINSYASAGTPYDIKSDWEAKYGTFPTVAGGKIFVMLQIITTEGVLSIPAGTSAFVS